MSEISDPGYEAQLKAALEQHYGRRFSPKQFGYWVELAFPGGPLDFTRRVSIDVARIISAIQRGSYYSPGKPRHRRGNGGTIDVQPPEWWLTHTRGLLQRFRPTQTAMLQAFGRSAPMDVQEQDDLLADLLEQQEPTDFDVPLHHHCCVFSESRDPTVSRVWVQDGVWPDTVRESPDLARTHALFFLATEAERMAQETGCDESAAVDFLLSDVVPDIPWIRFRADDWGAPGIEVRLGSAAVTPTELMQSYALTLEQWRADRSPVIYSAPKRRRSSRRRTLELLAFMGEHSPEDGHPRDWRSLRERWYELWPDWEFPSDKAMYEAFRRAKRSRDHE